MSLKKEHGYNLHPILCFNFLRNDNSIDITLPKNSGDQVPFFFAPQITNFSFFPSRLTAMLDPVIYDTADFS